MRRLILLAVALFSFVVSSNAWAAGPDYSNITYLDLRLWTDMYAHDYSLNVENGTYTVIDGDDAITLVENFYSDPWSGSAGGNVLELLETPGAIAISVTWPRTMPPQGPPYVFVPFPDGFTALDHGMFFPLTGSNATCAYQPRVGTLFVSGEWCICLPGCSGYCPSCPYSDIHDVPYDNDSLTLDGADPDDVLPLWD